MSHMRRTDQVFRDGSGGDGTWMSTPTPSDDNIYVTRPSQDVESITTASAAPFGRLKCECEFAKDTSQLRKVHLEPKNPKLILRL